MEKAMYKRYANVQPIGAISFCCTFGMVIYQPDEVDKYNENCDLICAWVNGLAKWGYHRHKVHYSTAGRAYVRKGSMRIYLDDVVKVW